jgi:CubicO group peptidase (beta-lactamase class C family)
VLAVVIEAITRYDYRETVRRSVIEPIGLSDDLFVGVPDPQHDRIASLYERDEAGCQRLRPRENNAAFWRAGLPGGGGYGTARGLAAFYQMMVGGGILNGRRFVSRRTIEYVTRNVTGDRMDGYMGMPMHRGLGPHLRGVTPTIRGLGTLASPAHLDMAASARLMRGLTRNLACPLPISATAAIPSRGTARDWTSCPT